MFYVNIYSGYPISGHPSAEKKHRLWFSFCGFNITIIAGLFTFLFSHLLGERKGAIVAAIGIIIYTLLVGANAAVVRATIFGMLTLLGHQLGRRQVSMNSLAFVAAGMAFVTPTVLWDVSFQLSFAATWHHALC